MNNASNQFYSGLKLALCVLFVNDFYCIVVLWLCIGRNIECHDIHLLLFVLMHVYMLLNTFLSSRQESPVLLVGCGEVSIHW